MTYAPSSTDNYCYRHPDRQSFVLCQRCGRTICAQCQTQAAVGVHCPECVREARGSMPRVKPQSVTRVRTMVSSGAPVATYAIIAVSVLLWLVETVSGNTLSNAMAFYTPLTVSQPWRLITTLFVHGSIFHVGFNMWSVYVFGSMLERQLGRGRFLALYFISGIGGSVAVSLIAPGVAAIGASGAIFGLLGAFFVIERHMGGRGVQILVLVALNLAIGFIIPGVAWQAHVGGVIVGAIIGLIYMRTRHRSMRFIQIAAIVALGILLVAAALVRSAALIG
ncbi:rhomboid family intramembrane serine protease [Frondihabitans sucicola]|uniref:Rhomboid family intramembrane serine protease n=1 Tax=Frondihabitans sucicola TaxID=1268041 RepID=A0ABM8GKG5_9MICO|nr:rhomboid family intramembrane serine protease [Frondihabitans sucicola]BDZ48699.1 rhomboid family intramembrane serine protease [Frondihabitans sucicola]